MRVLDKRMILQEVKITIEPLGVGYASRPAKAPKRGACRLCPRPLGSHPSPPPQHASRVKNTPRGHSSISVPWPMYRGRGAGRWAELTSGARGLPYRPPAYVRTAARRDGPEGTRSLPCWPCRAAAAAAVVWTGIVGAPRARPPLGQRTPPLLRRPLCAGGGGGGGRAWSMFATDLSAFGWAAAESAGGVNAPEIRLKTSGSDDGGRSARGDGGGWVSRCGQCLGGPRGGGGAHGDRLRAVAPPLLAGVRRGLLSRHPLAAAPRPHGPPG